MRIALFTGNYNYLKEGANQALNILVRYCEERCGWQVRVYSPVTDTPAFEPAGTLVPVPSIALPVRGEFRLALGLPGAIRRDIIRFAPDIVHVATPDILCTRAQTFARQIGVPVVASLHTHFETYLDFYRLGWLRPLVQAHLDRFYRRSDHVLAPTPALVGEMRRLRGDAHVSEWSRGIDAQLFRPGRRDEGWRAARGIAANEVAVLFFGRLVLEKGVETFVAALRELAARGVAARPLVVGAGPAEGLFKALAGAILTGHLQDAELARAVASADIMLNPSTTETFGNVTLEAMASGLPVLAADSASARALVADGVTGHICPPGDTRGFAGALARLIEQPDLRASMGEAALRASRAYSWDAASQAVAGAYLAVLGRG